MANICFTSLCIAFWFKVLQLFHLKDGLVNVSNFPNSDIYNRIDKKDKYYCLHACMSRVGRENSL